MHAPYWTKRITWEPFRLTGLPSLATSVISRVRESRATYRTDYEPYSMCYTAYGSLRVHERDKYNVVLVTPRTNQLRHTHIGCWPLLKTRQQKLGTCATLAAGLAVRVSAEWQAWQLRSYKITPLPRRQSRAEHLLGQRIRIRILRMVSPSCWSG